jgi:hypothetical protein
LNSPTPLKITGAGGEFGYNYKVSVDETSGNIVSSKECGKYVVGVALGVSDTASILDTNIRAALVIGGPPAVSIKGDFSMPGVGPKYAYGSIAADYEFWATDVSAIVQAGVEVPAGDGSVMSINSGAVEVALFGSTEKWKIDSQSNLSGKILNAITVDADVLVGGSMSPFDFNGYVSGTLSYDVQHSIVWPGGFEVGDCGWNQFGVDGTVQLKLNGSLTGLGGALHVTSNSIDGAVTGSVDAALDATVQWPTLWGNECTIEYDARVTGDLEITRSGGTTSATGRLYVREGDGKENDFQYTFNNL